MRRLGMKNKRRKSETMSNSGSEENGGGADNGNDETQTTTVSKNNSDTSSEVDASPAARKTTLKRRSRGATQQKPAAHADSGAKTKDEPAAAEEEERENGEKIAAKPSPNKRKKKEEQKASTSTREKSNDDNEYEVQRIVGHRTIKGRRQFLVRWKGYSESADTWENEKDLNCSKLIEEFLLNEEEVKTTKAKPNKPTKSKKSKDDQNTKGDNDKESLKEFEVEKIIEVHFKKNGRREFLIRWKGFGMADDTWEPEENLNCQELINKFMQKLEKVKTAEVRELRTNPAHTKRYTLSTHDAGRRLSRRHLDKQRATYHECDE